MAGRLPGPSTWRTSRSWRAPRVGEARMTVGTRSAYDSTHQAARNVATPARASTRARWVLTGSRTFIATGPASPRDDLEVGAPVLGAPAVAVVARHRLVGSVAD